LDHAGERQGRKDRSHDSLLRASRGQAEKLDADAQKSGPGG
jgi:hypothetical protein